MRSSQLHTSSIWKWEVGIVILEVCSYGSSECCSLKWAGWLLLKMSSSFLSIPTTLICLQSYKCILQFSVLFVNLFYSSIKLTHKYFLNIENVLFLMPVFTYCYREQTQGPTGARSPLAQLAAPPPTSAPAPLHRPCCLSPGTMKHYLLLDSWLRREAGWPCSQLSL